MSKSNSQPNAFAFPASGIQNLHRFQKDAMATLYHIFIQHENAQYAAQAAWAAFDILDDLEQHFSRFISNSDIAQLNRLEANESMVLSIPTFECIQAALKMHEQTFGAFDITIGRLYKVWLDKDRMLCMPTRAELDFARKHTGSRHIQLHPKTFTVTLSTSPLCIDLGGIGKGFAVDKMMDLLREWEISSAMISGGGSTVLASKAPCGMPGWPITVSSPLDQTHTLAKLQLHDQAFSGSGIIKSQHIIDPRKAAPVSSILSAWASAPDAATADALSTACTILTEGEMKKYHAAHPETLIMTARKDTHSSTGIKIFALGPWPE